MDNEMAEFCNDLLQSVKEMKAGQWARKTEFIPQEDGSVRRLVTLSDGTVERDEMLPAIVCTRLKTDLSQSQFAKLLGVSVRTLQDWEQGRKQPSGAAKTLLKVAAKHPEALLDVA